MTKDEARQKRDLYDQRLTDRDFARANKYAWWSFVSLGLACASILVVGLGSEINGLDVLIIVGVALCALCLGVSFLFDGKAALIRKYKYNKFFSELGGGNCIFDDRAIKLAKFNIAVGYLVITLAIGGPLFVLAFTLLINIIASGL